MIVSPVYWAANPFTLAFVDASLEGCYLRKPSSQVLVGSFVMDNEPAFGEEEAIRLSLEGCVDHFLLLFFAKVWQFINVLPSVHAIWHAEGEVEFELGENLSAEEMLFD